MACSRFLPLKIFKELKILYRRITSSRLNLLQRPLLVLVAHKVMGDRL